MTLPIQRYCEYLDINRPDCIEEISLALHNLNQLAIKLNFAVFYKKIGDLESQILDFKHNLDLLKENPQLFYFFILDLVFRKLLNAYFSREDDLTSSAELLKVIKETK